MFLKVKSLNTECTDVLTQAKCNSSKVIGTYSCILLKVECNLLLNVATTLVPSSGPYLNKDSECYIAKSTNNKSTSMKKSSS
mmetsp:Transcript_18359/g.1619  ORF Transcript_18359/g.1619 Transcript_18359/m.1619 type:complete len:82 (-) Transcript_18359:174-419(-)